MYWRKDSNRQQEETNRYLTKPIADSDTLFEAIPSNFLSRELLENGINTQKKEEFRAYLERRERESKKRIVTSVKTDRPLRDILAHQTIYEFPTFFLVHERLKDSFLSTRLS